VRAATAAAMKTRMDDILQSQEDSNVARRRGRQKGSLRIEGPSWIGYWWEDVRLSDGTISRARVSRAVCPAYKTDEKTGRARAVSKGDAQKIFNDTILDALEIRSSNPKSMATVKELVELKIRPSLVLKARKTQEHWRNMLDNHILPALGHKQLREITATTFRT
jgi:hypothetical protein